MSLSITLTESLGKKSLSLYHCVGFPQNIFLSILSKVWAVLWVFKIVFDNSNPPFPWSDLYDDHHDPTTYQELLESKRLTKLDQYTK